LKKSPLCPFGLQKSSWEALGMKKRIYGPMDVW
jgi:hypothetical protein